MKRAFDFVFSALLIVFLSPLMLVLALVVRLRLGSPVLFRQKRAGLAARPFEIIKFRSMNEHRDTVGKRLPDAQRLTPFGRWLRASSLDELPELWNVLKGEMSLVGPRPLPVHYLPRYSPEQARRHELKPGITGWAQIHGRNAQTWERRFELDLWYIDNQSFTLDLKILFMTLFKVFSREGINAEGEATMREFTGSQDGVTRR